MDRTPTHLVNPFRARYGPAEQRLIGRAHAAEAREVLRRRPRFAATPTVSARSLARLTGVGTVLVKDESSRLGSGSFKALGGAYAVVRVVLAEAQRRHGRPVGPDELGSAAVRAVAAEMTVTCGSAGNHGLSVAAGARISGARSVVWIGDRVPEDFAHRLVAEGAEVRRGGPSYADSLHAARRAADRDGWWLVADTSWPGYLDVPLDVMRGYTVAVDEAADACERAGGPATHVFVQAGVGGLAAAVAAHLRDRWGEAPRIAVVEPRDAACLLHSARAGRPVRVDEGRTGLGRLDCAEPSLLAWQLLSRLADAFLTVPDAACGRAAGQLAGDGVRVSACGAAGAAGLLHAAADPHLRSALGLGAASRILVFGTEAPLGAVPHPSRDPDHREGDPP